MEKRWKKEGNEIPFSKTFRDGKSSKASKGSLMDKKHEFGDVYEAD